MSLAVSSYQDASIVVWSTVTGEKTWELPARISAIAYSPSGERLAGGDTEGSITIWNSRSGEQLQNLRVAYPTSTEYRNAEIVDVRFVDESSIVSVHADVMRQWDLATGKERLGARTMRRGHRRQGLIAFSPEMHWMADCGSQEIFIYEYGKSSRPAATIDPDLSLGLGPRLTFCDRGRLLVLDRIPMGLARDTARVAVWETETQKPVALPLIQHRVISTLADPLRPRLIVKTRDQSNDFHLEVWDLESAQVIVSHPLPGNLEPLALHPNGEQIALAASAGIKLLDLTSGSFFPDDDDSHIEPIVDVAYSSDGQFVATASAGTKVNVWDSLTGAFIREVEFFPDERGRASNVAFTPKDNDLVVVGELYELYERGTAGMLGRDTYLMVGGIVIVGSSGANADTQRFAQNHLRALTVSDSPSGPVICYTSGRSSRLLGHIAKSINDGTDSFDQSIETLQQVVASRGFEDHRLWTVDVDGIARQWDMREGQKLKEHELPTSQCVASTTDIQADRVAFTTNGLDVAVFNLSDGTLLSRFNGHRPGVPIRNIHLSPRGDQVAVGTESRWFFIYEAATGNLVSEMRLPANATCASFSPDGLRIVVGLADSTAIQWTIN